MQGLNDAITLKIIFGPKVLKRQGSVLGMAWHHKMCQIPYEALMEASMTKSVNPRDRVHWYFPYDLVYPIYICFAKLASFVIMMRMRMMVVSIFIEWYLICTLVSFVTVLIFDQKVSLTSFFWHSYFYTDYHIYFMMIIVRMGVTIWYGEDLVFDLHIALSSDNVG